MISRNDLAHLFRNPGPIVHPPHPAAQPQYNTANMQASQRAEAERREKMRRIAKNPTDKNIPEGVEVSVEGLTAGTQILAKEIELPAGSTLVSDEELLVVNITQQVSAESSGIDADAFDFESENNATYRVKIQGRLLDEEGDEGLEDDEEDEKDADAMYVCSAFPTRQR